MARQRKLQNWGTGGDAPGPKLGGLKSVMLGLKPLPPSVGGMAPGVGGVGRGMGRMSQHQAMVALMAQRQRAQMERMAARQSKEELARRFKELLMDKGVSGGLGCWYLISL